MTNVKRTQNGLRNLSANWELNRVAQYKAQDMRNKNYFSHTSPTYGSPFDMIRAFGISYRSAGENIAKGQTTPAQVVEAWWNSAGHRANILNSSYTQISVGYVADGKYWVQMFIGWLYYNVKHLLKRQMEKSTCRFYNVIVKISMLMCFTMQEHLQEF